LYSSGHGATAATRIAEPFLIWNQWLPEGLFGIFESLVTLVGVPLTVNTTSAEVWILSTNNFISLLAIVSVTTLYSTTGGLRSVVATDKLQLLLMLGGTAVFSYIAVDKAGGLAALKTNLDNALAAVPFMDSSKVLSFTPTEKSNAGIGVLLVFALQWLIQINSDGTGYLAQRTMACENEKEAKKAAFVFTFTQILIRSLIWIPLGVALIILYPMAANVVSDTVVSQREFTYVLAMNEILPIGLKGVMVTAMLAALASTVDTHMNWGSSYWSHDFYDRLYCQELKGRKADSKTLVLVARLSNFIILAISLVIMANLGSIKTAWEASLLIGASMGVPLILRWVWWRMSAWAELAGIISSIVLIPLSFVLIDSDASEWRILFVSFFSLVITIATVFFKGPESKQTLERFYNQVKPIGFWGEYGDNSKELFKGIAGMLTCGLSLFCLLVGMGSLLVDSPAPIESNTLWLSLNFLVGFGLIPIWYRLGFK
jgi:SSS family solute:Na+ symporter